LKIIFANKYLARQIIKLILHYDVRTLFNLRKMQGADL